MHGGHSYGTISSLIMLAAMLLAWVFLAKVVQYRRDDGTRKLREILATALGQVLRWSTRLASWLVVVGLFHWTGWLYDWRVWAAIVIVWGIQLQIREVIHHIDERLDTIAKQGRCQCRYPNPERRLPL